LSKATDKKKLLLKTICKNQDTDIVLKGEAMISLPRP